MTDLVSWMEEKLCALNLTDTMNIKSGFTRLSFSKEEKAAHNQFQLIAEELGLKTFQDPVGNRWAVWEVDKNAPTIAMGSHLDTVYNGGGYDGVAGVLCALASIKHLKDIHFKPAKNIAIICFVAEESARFSVSTIGSKALTGMLDKSELISITDREGISLKQAMEEFGVCWDAIEQASLPIGRLEHFMELHIEQGTQLAEKDAAIGIVDGVASPVRLKVRAVGKANHTGSTPMDRRQDALVAISPLFTYVNEEAIRWNQSSIHPLVATVSTIKLTPNAMNVIPGEVEAGIDIRSVDDELKRDFAKEITHYCQEIALKNQIEVEVSTLADEDSALLDLQTRQKLAEACRELGFKHIVMNSGAGHDVMNMARKWPAGLIFIPCKDGISHHAAEHASIENLEKGTQVLITFLQNNAI